MKRGNWLLSTTGIITTAVALTLIVLAESIFPPWAPYFILYAGIAIFIPLRLKTCALGSFKKALSDGWKLMLVILVLDAVWEVFLSDALTQFLLKGAGLASNPLFSVSTAIDTMLKTAATKLGWDEGMAFAVYGIFYVFWAPVGEELFYRGYIQGGLRAKHGFWMAALVSTFFFAFRHATHFFFLWPDVPFGAAAIWAISCIVPGFLLSLLYEKTKSLHLPILVHFTVNVLTLALTA